MPDGRSAAADRGPAAGRGAGGRLVVGRRPVAYNATFASGRFTSREAATGAVLAEGNYTKTGQSQASIIYTSRSRNQQMSVNCNQMSADRLACVDANGNRFEFARKA